MDHTFNTDQERLKYLEGRYAEITEELETANSEDWDELNAYRKTIKSDVDFYKRKIQGE
jgi:hypothetical protein